MSNEKSDIYWERKQQYYTRPAILLSIEDKINGLCEVIGMSFRGVGEVFATIKNHYWPLLSGKYTVDNGKC